MNAKVFRLPIVSAAPNESSFGAAEEDAVPEVQRARRLRGMRKREVRARTISVKRMTKRDVEIGRMLYPETNYPKPAKRAECAEGARPCPYVSCRHHLFLDVSSRTGAIKLNFPDLEVWEMNESCSLDIADRGGTTLADVGAIMNVTPERIRQIEKEAAGQFGELAKSNGLPEIIDIRPSTLDSWSPRSCAVESDDDNASGYSAANDNVP